MYRQTEFDAAFLRARADQFRAQVERRIAGALTEEEFKPLRLMNGLYLQLHAYMLRVAIPYGTLNGRQMRQLAMIAERWDRGYGHFTTRQNIQFNWPRLADVPDMLDALADVGMHAIQTSGNTIRNVTADHFAGAAAEEVADPRPIAELIRQWSTDHPEFQFLPRKFKIAVTGSAEDRAATAAHDIGLRLTRREGVPGATVLVGGGLGRTPVIAEILADFVPLSDLLPYLEAVVAVYNLIGRRDNKYKARIKITLRETGAETFRDMVATEFAARRESFDASVLAVLDRISTDFAAPDFEAPDFAEPAGMDMAAAGPALRSFIDTNTHPHRAPGYTIVSVSLKAHGQSPGDASADQMRVLADLAEEFAHDELRISHEQNVVLPHVPLRHLPALHARLAASGLATANLGLASDIVACPGMDYCALATARSIPVAQDIAMRIEEMRLEHEVGTLRIKISGCINACGHHHLGHIGILGLDRAGVETYQITLGGDGGPDAAIGQRTGPGFAHNEIVPAIERLIRAYLDLRSHGGDTFLDVVKRLGLGPFKAALYDTPEGRTHAA